MPALEEVDEDAMSRVAKDGLLMFALEIIHQLSPTAIPRRLRTIEAMLERLDDQPPTLQVRQKASILDTQQELLQAVLQVAGDLD